MSFCIQDGRKSITVLIMFGMSSQYLEVSQNIVSFFFFLIGLKIFLDVIEYLTKWVILRMSYI